ncbi:MAG: hypothetical protein II285_00755, partial [Flavobacteriales bacterium]|nr:hypothetical protein [Flavobacteriales bacterium]
MRKHLLFLIIVLCGAGSLSAQKKDYVTVGLGVDYALSEVFAKGGEGGMDLAKVVCDVIDRTESNFKPI